MPQPYPCCSVIFRTIEVSDNGRHTAKNMMEQLLGLFATLKYARRKPVRSNVKSP